MSTQLQTLSHALKKAGHSTTKARKEVFEVLSSHHQPLTMREIGDILSKKIDRASVYRVIEVFEKIGVVHRVYTGWKYKIELSEVFHPHHHHIYCTTCHSTISFKEPVELEHILRDLERKHSFTISSHQFEIQGICPNCKR